MRRYIKNLLRAIFNRYEAAQYSPTRPYIQTSYQSAKFDNTPSARRRLVELSRDFECNDPMLNRMADIFENYTVGSGVPVMPSSSNAEWNVKAKASWEKFCKYPILDSRMSLATFQGVMARRWFFDGEFFILLTNDGRYPRLQGIETHRINTPPSMAKDELKTVVDGVQIDASGRPIGYYISDEDANGNLSYSAPRDASLVIQLSEPGRVNEYRSMPWCHPVANLIQDLDTLHRLEMKSAQDAAELSLFVRTQSGEIDTTGMSYSRFSSSGVTADGTATTQTAKDYYNETTGGRIRALRAGDDIVQSPALRPSVVTQEYWKSLRTEICNGIGIPYCMVYPESQQGTTYRGALSVAETFFRCRFSTISSVLTRIYEYYMGWAIKNDPTLAGAPIDWYACSIQPPRSPNVDVGRNSSAMINELKAGATTYDMVYGPLGLDWREQFRRLRDQQQFAESIGLKLNEPTAPIAKPDEDDNQGGQDGKV